MELAVMMKLAALIKDFDQSYFYLEAIFGLFVTVRKMKFWF